jgi:hypothetical protein
MLLAVAALVVGARSVLFLLLLRIGVVEVVWVLGPPLLVGLPLLLLATLWLATGLALVEPGVGVIPTAKGKSYRN